MALKASIASVLALAWVLSLAAPAYDPASTGTLSSTEVAIHPRQVQSQDPESFGGTVVVPVFSGTSPGEPGTTLTSEIMASSTSIVPSSTMDSSLSYTPSATTITTTEDIPETVTITVPPITITETTTATKTDTETITLSPSASSRVGTHTPSPSQTLTSSGGLGPAKSIWAAPATLTDLASFQVSKLAGGEDNLRFVKDVPIGALSKVDTSSRSQSTLSDEHDHPSSSSSSSTSLIQLLFPSGSIDPGQSSKPQGGTQFYASPLDLGAARNVTLQYSVFFPDDFNWVLGGKLPGLYGGHMGCSGGDKAVDCFSTRMMWREGGVGELYLYAPKDAQPPSLCADPSSVCSSTYGLSIGRGSFSFRAGGWTTIRQTVVLNTVGRRDGVFGLEVDGRRRVYREDVVYRGGGDVGRGVGKGGGTGTGTGTGTRKAGAGKASATKVVVPRPTRTPSNGGGGGGGLLGPLLGGLLGLLDEETETTDALGDLNATVQSTLKKVNAQGDDSAKNVKEVGFAGIFFSTFFGGHEDKYATPKDQYIWLRDFAVAYNS